jgi:hypothetical protein
MELHWPSLMRDLQNKVVSVLFAEQLNPAEDMVSFMLTTIIALETCVLCFVPTAMLR